MNEAEQREEALFEAALQLPADQRAAFLNQTCAGDAGLRRRVEALLGAFDRAGGFMKQPATPMPPVALVLPPADEAPDRIGRYKLLEQIGEGGCGVVYVAEQEEPVRRRVALKVIKLGMDSKQVIARFDAERQALAMMDHPNIAKVFDAGATETGRPYFVMELVRGFKITDYCDQHQLPPRERLDLFIQVCRAIQHAHQKGIIHRDIKPSNILVTLHDGVPVPKVIDFGIAKATQGRLTDQTVYTAFEQFIGTPACMSPEQAEMSGLDIDTRSDIYSLGVLLYELLTGKTPFDAKELLSKGLDEMRRAIREVEPVKPSTRLTQELVAADVRRRTGETEIPHPIAGKESASSRRLLQEVRGDLDWIVMKCLEKDRARRYETASGLATDIARHLNNEPIVARPPTWLYRFQKSVQRNKLAFISASSVLAVIVFALVALSFSNVRLGRERNQKQSALIAARKSEQDSKDQLFLALRNQAQARRYSRQMGQRFESLTALAAAARIRKEDELRDEAMAALALPDLRRGPAWRATPDRIKGPAFDGAYTQYADADDKGIIRIHTVPDNHEVQHFNSSQVTSRMPNDFVLSPDGKFLANLEGPSRLRVRRCADGQSVLREVPEQCWAIAFSPDSRHLAASQGDQILCFDLITGRESRRWQARSKVNWIEFSPDNRTLAACYYTASSEVSIYDSGNGSLAASLPCTTGQYCVAWHPEGKHLATGGGAGSIQLWDVPTQRRLAILDGHAQEVTSLSFHPGGALLGSGSWDGTERVWDVASGRQWLQIPFPLVVRFSGDGRWFGVIGGLKTDYQLVEVAQGSEYRTLDHRRHVADTAPIEGDISPDGRLLAMGMMDGLCIWDLASGRELAHLSIGDTLSVLFQPAGDELLTLQRNARVLQRWTIQTNLNAASELRLSPSGQMSLPFPATRLASAARGSELAVVGDLKGEVAVLDVNSTTAMGPVLSHPMACYVALSRDGRWMATSGWHSKQVSLWDAAARRLIHQWPSIGASKVAFSPDNRTLAISDANEICFWDLASRKRTQTIRREVSQYPSSVAFSADGKLVAMEMTPGVIHVKDAATFRTVARLTDPFADRSSWLAFTPSGTQMVVACSFARVIHVWDFRAIRAQLKPIGLDWDWPEFPDEDRSEQVAPLSRQ